MVAGIELAEQVGKKPDVGELVGRAAAQVEVVVHVGDPVGVELVCDAGQRRLDHGGVWLGRRVLDVCHVELRQRRERLGRVRGLLLGAKGRDLGCHGSEFAIAHLGALVRELRLLVGRVASLHGHELHLGAVAALADELA